MCSHETTGASQFTPNEGAHPNIGKVGELMKLEETRVEVMCVGRDVMLGAVDALKRYGNHCWHRTMAVFCWCIL